MKKNQNREYTLAKVLAGVGAAALLGSAAAAASAWLRGRRAEHKPQPRPVQRKPRKRSRGFSLAEVLLVVGIIAILAGVTAVSVFHYQRDSHRLEMDSVAREIFVAAQNHLIEAKGQGYLGKGNGKGLPEKDSENNLTGRYYFVVGFGDIDGAYESPDSPSAMNTLLSLMLPYASVEENIRLGGSYIIRYDPESAAIQDVFYAEKSGKAFGHTFRAADYSAVLLLAGDDKKTARRNVSGFENAVVGWYGGTEQAGNPETKPIELKKPQIILHNEDTLWLEVRDYNTTEALGGGDKAISIFNALQRKIIVTGELSNNTVTIFPTETAGLQPAPNGTVTADENGIYDEYRFTLDDITVADKHFQKQFAALLPGETITVTVRIDCTYTGTPVIGADSMNAPVTNSLFDTGSLVSLDEGAQTTNKALISYIRHLENLDPSISGLDKTVMLNGQASSVQAKLLCAEQTKDLYWHWENRETIKDFLSNTIGKTKITTVTDSSRSDGKAGSFLPVYPIENMVYLGKGFKIWGVAVDTSEDNAGLFGELINCIVLDLNLINPNIRGAGNAGAVSGSAEYTKFGNIAVYNDTAQNGLSGAKYTGFGSAGALPVLWIGERGGLFGGLTNREPWSVPHDSKNKEEPYVAGKVSGGLVGSLVGGSVNFCSASVYVRAGEGSGAIAGGLVGSASGAKIQGSYSGGHTYKGKYNNDWNVEAVGNGSIAGGLVGSASGLTVEKSYNTCSVKGYTVGGFIGTASGTTMENTYTTGRVNCESHGSKDPYVNELKNRSVIGNNNRYIITFKVDTESGTERAMSKYDRENPDNSEWEEQAYTGCVGIRPEQWNDAANADFFLEDKALANPYDTELTYEYFFPSIAQLYGAGFTDAFKNVSETGEPKSSVVHYGDWYVPIPVAMVTRWVNADTLTLEINYFDYMDENGYAPETILVAVTGKESGKTRVFQLYTNLTDPSNPSYQVEKEGYLNNDGSIQWLGSTNSETGKLTPYVRDSLQSAWKEDGAWTITTHTDEKKAITLTFDDIRKEETRFNTLMCSGTENTSNPENALADQNFIPGENLTARVSLMPTWSDLKKETGYVTNSLFAYQTGCRSDPLQQTGDKTAYITNLRHLQNLDISISQFAISSGATLEASQMKAIDGSTDFWRNYHYKPVNTQFTKDDNTVINYTLHYTGDTGETDGIPNNRISSIGIDASIVTGVTNAGIFDTLRTDDTVTNLELVDISAAARDITKDENTTKGHAGALAGTSSGTVTGVLVRCTNTSQYDAKAISSVSGAAGGLIGSVTGGSVTQCAAAVYVESSSGAAGGLIGSASGYVKVEASYSGGRTHTYYKTDGTTTSYFTDYKNSYSGPVVYNVKSSSGPAGGLIGNADAAATLGVNYCYSTCSVSGATFAGGLIGHTGTGSVSVYNSYVVGAVHGNNNNNTGAFIGLADNPTLGSGKLGTDQGKNYYYELANGSMPALGGTGTGNVAAIDATLDIYNAFVYPRSSTEPAADSQGYNNKDNSHVPPWHFPTVKQLGYTPESGETTYLWTTTHYGDWPVYETLVPNTKADS